MKKSLVLAMALVVGFAFSVNAEVKTTQTEKVTGATTKTTDTATVKTDKVDIKAKETVTTNVNEPGKVESTTKIEGKNAKATRTMTETPDKVTGTTKVDVKKGAIDDLKIDWTYEKVQVTGGGYNYVLKYNVKENANANLAKELKLTPEQAKMITAGEHSITSTSEQTGPDMVKNFRSFILKDIQNVVAKKEAATKK